MGVKLDHKAFSPKIRSMSHVYRWATLPCIRPNDDAGHSFYVVYYSKLIADLIGWQGKYQNLLWEATIHDVDETVTGDILGQVKRAIVDPDKAQAFIDDRLKERLPYAVSNDMGLDETREVEAIVKAADWMDALFYAMGETLLGNQMMACRLPHLIGDLKTAWDKLPAPAAALRGHWERVVQPSITKHRFAESYDL